MPQHYDDNPGVENELRYMSNQERAGKPWVELDDRVNTLPPHLLQSEVWLRKGVRSNEDPEDPKSHSTVLMNAERDANGNWYVFPSLFQNEDGKWVDLSGETVERTAAEALRRRELVNFGSGPESMAKAKAHAKGAWKTPTPQEEAERLFHLSPVPGITP